MGVEDGDQIAREFLSELKDILRRAPEMFGKLTRGVRKTASFFGALKKKANQAQDTFSCLEEMLEKLGVTITDALKENGTIDLGDGAKATLKDGVVNVSFDFSDNMVEGEDGLRPLGDFSELESSVRTELYDAGISDLCVFTIDDNGIGNLTYAQADHEKVCEGISKCKDLCGQRVADAQAQVEACEKQPTLGLTDDDIDKALSEELDVDVGDIKAAHGTQEYKELTNGIAGSLQREFGAQGVEVNVSKTDSAISVSAPKGQEKQAEDALSAIQDKYSAEELKQKAREGATKKAKTLPRTIAGKQVRNYEPIASRMLRARKAADDKGLQHAHKLGLDQREGLGNVPKPVGGGGKR